MDPYRVIHRLFHVESVGILLPEDPRVVVEGGVPPNGVGAMA